MKNSANYVFVYLQQSTYNILDVTRESNVSCGISGSEKAIKSYGMLTKKKGLRDAGIPRCCVVVVVAVAVRSFARFFVRRSLVGFESKIEVYEKVRVKESNSPGGVPNWYRESAFEKKRGRRSKDRDKNMDKNIDKNKNKNKDKDKDRRDERRGGQRREERGGERGGEGEEKGRKR